jgi:hypothetical protein
MSTRVLPHASASSARGTTTPLDPRGAHNNTRERARTVHGRRIRDDARDGLAVAAMSLAGSVALTLTLGLLLRWLG